MGCYGDGGAVFTNDDELAAVMRSIGIHGKGQDKYDNVRIGMNSRLDTLQAAILQVKFKAFIDYELEKVNQAAAFYTEKLKGLVKTPVVPEGYYSSWAQYTIHFRISSSGQAAGRFEGRHPQHDLLHKAHAQQTAFARWNF